MEPAPAKAVSRFGPFEVDARAAELRKNGTRIRLPEQPFRILLLLLENPGEIVTRYDICHRLWPNETAVEYDQSINTAMRRLRTVLGESADQPRYIETVAKRGYRFIAAVESAGIPPHYRVLEKLGEGGMGVVYRAEDRRLGRYVAVKFVRHGRLTETMSRRFEQEARAASGLNHPHICTIHGLEDFEGEPGIVMELVEGETLARRLARERIPLTEALQIAVQIAGALAEAHRAGIVHRDLKPANIMLTRNGVKVLDFGLARMSGVSGAVAPGTGPREAGIAGTLAYLPPEQLDGAEAGPAGDVFAFGLVMYEMLSGRRAFDADSAERLKTAIRDCRPAPLTDAPAEVARLVERCLAHDPQARWQTAVELEEELKRIAAAIPARSVNVPAGRRRPWWPPAAVAAVVLAFAAWALTARRDVQLGPERLERITSYSGSETYPSFSPDGRRIAFGWDGEKGDQPGIYVKPLDQQTPLRLTTGADAHPAWSPDGERIAFVRTQPDPGIYMIPVLGGDERKITGIPTYSQISWSPDSKLLAAARGARFNSAIVVISAESGAVRQITSPKLPAFDTAPAFSPDGRRLTYAGCAGRYSCDIFEQSLAKDGAREGSPRLVTRHGVEIYDTAWSRDGHTVIYSGAQTLSTPYLWRTGRDASEPPQRIEVAGQMAYGPAVSPVGNRLAFHRSLSDFDIWRYQTRGSMEPLISSSLMEFAPEYSPDGSRIVFCSNRAGRGMELWLAEADGAKPVQLTRGPGRNQGSPRWSPDGRWIAFDSEGKDSIFHIYLLEASGGTPRQITSGEKNDHMPVWSSDGKWIYFYSERSGGSQVWRVAAAGGSPERVTTGGGLTVRLSPDGKTVYYTKEFSGPLFAKPVSGGEERQVLPYIDYKSFFPVKGGIYYTGHRGPDGFPLEYFDFATGSHTVLAKIKGQVAQGLSASPDGKSILFTASVYSGADLLTIENFR